MRDVSGAVCGLDAPALHDRTEVSRLVLKLMGRHGSIGDNAERDRASPRPLVPVCRRRPSPRAKFRQMKSVWHSVGARSAVSTATR